MARARARAAARPRQDLFDALDINGSGLLDKTKLNDGLARGLGREVPEDELDAMLLLMDKSAWRGVACRGAAWRGVARRGVARTRAVRETGA